jgi:hypothetical protein
MRCLESLSRDSFSGKRTVFLIDNAQSLDRSLTARHSLRWTSRLIRPLGTSGLRKGAPAALSLVLGLRRRISSCS